MKIKEMMGRKGENDDSPKGGIFFYFQYTHTDGSVLEKRRLLTPKDFPLFSKGVSLWLEIQKKSLFAAKVRPKSNGWSTTTRTSTAQQQLQLRE